MEPLRPHQDMIQDHRTFYLPRKKISNNLKLCTHRPIILNKQLRTKLTFSTPGMVNISLGNVWFICDAFSSVVFVLEDGIQANRLLSSSAGTKDSSYSWLNIAIRSTLSFPVFKTDAVNNNFWYYCTIFPLKITSISGWSLAFGSR